MSHLVRVSVCTLVVATALTFAGPAAAVIRQDNGRFVFSPYTDNNDPVSILQIGGRSDDAVCNFGQNSEYVGIARTTRCMSSHIKTAWKNTRHLRKGTEMKERRCNGRDHLGFVGAPGVENLRSTSTSSFCEDQYHVRMWGDYPANPFKAGQWSIMTSYYEVRTDIPRILPGSRNHDIDESWETTENTVMYEMTHSSRGEATYCGQNDYRPVPGQVPGTHRTNARKKALYNNGRLSRISVQKPDNNKPLGHRCDGA